MGERFQRQYATWEEFLKAQGHEEGELLAVRSTLVRLLQKRFGEVTTSVRARVEQAGFDEATQWIDRVLDAQTIEDVFASE